MSYNTPYTTQKYFEGEKNCRTEDMLIPNQYNKKLYVVNHSSLVPL